VKHSIVLGHLPALLTVLLLSSGAPAAHASPATAWQVELQLKSVHHADALSLGALDDEDQALRQLAPRRGRNLAYVDDEARLSLRRDAWRLSVLARSRGHAITNHDTLDLATTVARRGKPSEHRHWYTTLDYSSFQGAGGELAYRWASSNGWFGEVGVQALQLRHWRERQLDGNVSYDAGSQAYAFDLRSLHADDRLRFPFQQAFDQRGMGVLFSSEIGWSSGAWGVRAGFRDLGRLQWDGLPQQQAWLSTQTEDYDADGLVIYRPLLTGRNSQGRRSERSRGQGWLHLSYQWTGVGEFGVGSEWIPRFGPLPVLGWRGALGPADASVQWRHHEQRLDFSVAWRGWQLQWGANTLGSGRRSQSMGLRKQFDL